MTRLGWRGAPKGVPLLLWRFLSSRFFRFGLVGVIGFIIDSSVLYAALPLLGRYGGKLMSLLVAATTAWMLNRTITFRGVMHGSLVRQWALYLMANSAGASLNYGAFAILTALVPLCFHHPILPQAAGALCGMGANFTLSKRIVFRQA